MSRSLLLLAAVLLVACAPPPPVPTIAAGGPASPVVVTDGAARAAAAEAADEPFVEEADPGPVPIRASDPWRGKRDALVTIVEFGDFQCPFCGRVNETLHELERRYGPDQIRIVWKNNPLPFHPKAAPAALVAAKLFERFGNAGFWQAHDAFMADQQHLDGAIAAQAARLGLSPDDVDALVKSESGRVEAWVDESRARGATGTPNFLINGVRVSGAQPLEKFVTVIDEQLGKARDLLARGTPRRSVYAALAKAQFTAEPPPPATRPDDKDETVWAVPIGRSAVRGKADALVTIVTFSEFQCPFCSRVAPTIAKVQATYGDRVRYVFKHNPLPFHPNALPAAELTAEARAQRGDLAFWKAHDLLFSKECVGNPKAQDRADCEANNGQWIDHQMHLDEPGLKAAAAQLGLDLLKVADANARHSHLKEIQADQDLADDLQANGTPHFFINGRRFVGAQPFERFAAVIDEELAKAEALVKSGIKPAQLYAHIIANGKTPPPPERKAVPAPTRENPSRGPANAKVVVQFWSDFQCPFCARVRDTIDALEKAYPGQVRVVWRNLPLPMHPQAEPAAEAAMEAFRQKGNAGFWAMYDLLYQNQGTPGGLERPALDGYAAQLKLDPARFANALDTNAHHAVIESDAKAAAAAGISGTPAFVVNGYYVSGAQPLAKFKKVVGLALAGK